MAEDWSDEELRSAVREYLSLINDTRQGLPINKARVYRELSEKFGRTPKSFEYRMQNISYVLSLMGRSRLKGLVPAKNVGANVASKIEAFIAEIEGAITPNVVALEIETRQSRAKGVRSAPAGAERPTRSTSSVTSYKRDPEVRAWVLTRAAGHCECCESPAPFTDASGLPFLEVHHVRQLADGGSDRVSNAVALCPNCHRLLHFSAGASEAAEALFDRIPELVRETAE